MSSYQLHCGEGLEFVRSLPPQSVDLIATDLPYGTTACKWDTIIPFVPMWEAVRHVLKPRGAFVTTASQPFTSLLVCSNLEWFRVEWTWDKIGITGYLDANQKPLKRHENICVFGKSGEYTYNPIMGKGKPYELISASTPSHYAIHERARTINCGERYPTSILQISNANFKERYKYHPTQKPVALYEYLIRTYSNPGDTVLDFCAGSGTTIIAAIRTGRNAIGCEKEPEYFEIMERRAKEAAASPSFLAQIETPREQAEQKPLFDY